jgi:uncharacterized protein (TIGR02246 family)
VTTDAELASVEAVRRVKARYLRCLDTHDWVAFRSVFTDDAEMDVSADGAGVVQGGDAIVESISTALTGVVSVHQATNAEITVVGPEASAIWAMTDHLVFPDGTQLRGAGHYHETYRRQNGEWRIAGFRLSRLRRDFSRPDQATGR